MWVREHRGVSAALLVLALTGAVAAAQSAAPWVTSIEAPQYFAVSVKDVDRSVEWYCQALGLRKLDDNQAPDRAWRIVNLRNDHLFVEVIWDRRDADTKRSRGFSKVGFRVPDVDEVAGRVEEATGERPRVLDFPRHRIRILQLLDPDGNKIQLSSPLAERGDAAL